MTQPTPDNVVPIKAPAKKAISSTEKIWGKKVMGHGYTGVPSLLIRSQARLGLSSTQMTIILQLLDYYFDKTRPPFPTKKQLSDRTGLNPKTIQKNVKALEEAGYIQREARTTNAGDYGSNIYHLDGLIAKVQELEPEYAQAKAMKEAIDKTAETPKHKRRASP